jgi:hypothetical protein
MHVKGKAVGHPLRSISKFLGRQAFWGTSGDQTVEPAGSVSDTKQILLAL